MKTRPLSLASGIGTLDLVAVSKWSIWENKTYTKVKQVFQQNIRGVEFIFENKKILFSSWVAGN